MACPDMKLFNVSFQPLPALVTARTDRAHYLDGIHLADAPFVDRSSISFSVLIMEFTYYVSFKGQPGSCCGQFITPVTE
jgi:hypothetical protein